MTAISLSLASTAKHQARWPVLPLIALLTFSIGCASGGAVVSGQDLNPAEASATQSPEAAPSPAASKQDVQSEAAVAEAVVADKTTAEEDVEWLFDEERGLEYTIFKADKIEGTYKWIDEKTIRVRGGVTFEVLDQDDDYLWIKVWKRTPRVQRAEVTPEEAEAERLEIEKSFQVSWDEVDRLKLLSASEGLPSRGQWRNAFDLGDVNGDGHTDIVFGPSRKGRSRPNIFLGDSQGNWKRWSDARFPARPLDYGAVAVGDLNGDGLQDLAFGVHLRGMMAYVQEEGSSFKPWDEGIAWDEPGAGGDATSFSSRRLELVDWDGDGDQDIVALGEGPKGSSSRATGSKRNAPKGLIDTSRGLVLYVNEGEGQWQGERLNSGVHFGDHLALGDLNGDGNQDVVIGTRRAGAKDLIWERGEGDWLESRSLDAMRDGGFVSSLAIGDLDQDGWTDIALGYRVRSLEQWYSVIDLFFGGADQQWERVGLSAVTGRSDFTALDIGDIDGDEFPDVVALTGMGGVEMYLGRGERSFAKELTPEGFANVEGCTGWMVAIEDLNRDGLGDLVAAFAGEPAGMVGIRNLEQPGCPGEGSLRAWITEATTTEP